ncbi:MAG TPA: hypothetical protein VLF62_03890 [Candidatus Saccharimonadales bacterium]|nr:hypothetical protein [Candidatus Saccharimonadales bacterium]
MGQTKINPADISPGYDFRVGFEAPAPDVASAEAVLDIMATRLGIPEEHNLRILEKPPEKTQDPRMDKYLGSVAFIDWESVNPDAVTATLHVDVLQPNWAARAVARVFRRPAKASVWVLGQGARPFDDGYGARWTPNPTPVTPQGDLLLV